MNNEMRNNKEILANKSSRGIVKVTRTQDEVKQIKAVIEHVEYNLKKNKSCTSNAILYRTNAESKIVVEELIRRRISFKFLDGEYNFLEHFIAKDMIAYLRVSMDCCDSESFLRIINKPNRFIGKLDLEKLRTNPYKEDCFEKLLNLDRISINAMKVLNNLRKKLKKLKKMSMNDSLDYIYEKIGYKYYLIELCKRREQDYEDMEGLFNKFKEYMSGFSSLEDLFISDNKTVQSRESDTVILSTIHGVKGMEFNNVYIINCVEEHLPYVNSIEHNLEEERRLFYVAITRAIDNLYMYIPERVNGKKKLPSRFINECGNSSFVEC